MSITFYISPFTASKWIEFGHSPTEKIGDLVINPPEYKAGLIDRWTNVQIRESTADSVLYFPLQWTLPTSRVNFSGLQGRLYPNLQVVSFGSGPKESFLEFILWHRKFIPANYSLYLFNSSSIDNLPIMRTTTEQDIINFTGIVD